MNVTKNLTVNDLDAKATIETGEMERAELLKTTYGERASGIIRLIYKDGNFYTEMKYDTRVGRDGLETYITASVGDVVKANVFGNWARIQVTEHMIKACQRVKAKTNVVQKRGNGDRSFIINDVEKLNR